MKPWPWPLTTSGPLALSSSHPLTLPPYNPLTLRPSGAVARGNVRGPNCTHRSCSKQGEHHFGLLSSLSSCPLAMPCFYYTLNHIRSVQVSSAFGALHSSKAPSDSRRCSEFLHAACAFAGDLKNPNYVTTAMFTQPDGLATGQHPFERPPFGGLVVSARLI